MRTVPDADDKYEQEELAELNAEPWMVEQLSLNPGYVHWGPHEDYMWVKGEGWNAPITKESWAEFDIVLDELNECANFYFEIARDSKECETCGGNGYNVDAQWVTESFYSHSSPFKAPTTSELRAKAVMDSFGGGRQSLPPLGHGGYPDEETIVKHGPDFRAFCEEMRRGGSWSNRITQDEVEALQERGRLRTWKDGKWERVPLTAEAVNAAQSPGMGADYNHDAINRSILCETRCKRFGIPLRCQACKGNGYVYTAPAAHLQLVIWVLHPRKGASRGVEVKRVDRGDLPAVYTWLRTARDRNRDRFAKIPA